MSKESHFSFDNLGKEFASSLKFIQYALICLHATCFFIFRCIGLGGVVSKSGVCVKRLVLQLELARKLQPPDSGEKGESA